MCAAASLRRGRGPSGCRPDRLARCEKTIYQEEQCHNAQTQPTTDTVTYLLNIAPATSSASAAATAGFTARSYQTALRPPKTTSSGYIAATGPVTTMRDDTGG